MLGANPVGHFEGLVQAEVRVMLVVTYGIKRDVPQAVQLAEFRFRNAAHVGDVCYLSEPEPEHRQFIVKASDWNHGRISI